MKEDLNSIDDYLKIIMNNANKLSIGVGLISLPFLLSFFWDNFTGTAIGLTILGGAMTIKLFDLKVKSKAIWYMWIAIIIVIAFLLGMGYIIPKITFS